MGLPTRKQSADKRAVYLTNLVRLGKGVLLVDLNQKWLKQEIISWYKDSQKHSGKSKRKHNNNDDELSVISAAKRPEAIQGTNAFNTTPHWTTPREKDNGRSLQICIYLI